MSYSGIPEPDYKSLFEQAPGLYMILDHNLRIVAASDAYLRATLTRREEIIGRYVFDVFPEYPDDDADADEVVPKSMASFKKVLKTGLADSMDIQRHDVRRPESEGGGFEVRYWSPVNSPILNPDGSTAYIFHRVENVTDYVMLKQKGLEQEKVTDKLLGQAFKMEADLYSRSREAAEISLELKQANQELKKHRSHLEKLVRERTAGLKAVNEQLLREIEERKHAEEEAHARREWLRVTLASIGDAVIATDSDGLVTFITPAATELTGRKSGEAIGRPIQQVFRIIDEKTRKPAENIIERVISEGIVINLAANTVLIAHGGREIPIEDSAAPIRDSSGNLIGVVLVFHDVTEKRRAQETLRQREEEFRALVENAPDVISLFDRNLRRIYVNSEIRENTGQNSSFMIGKSLTEAGYPDSFTKPLNAALQSVFATGSEETVELDYEAPKGRIWLQIRCAPLRTADGSVERVMSIGRDITDRKKMEEELRKSHEELEIRVRERTAELSATVERLELMNKELQDFAFVASHDLQEPLRKIQTFSDMTMKNCAHSLGEKGKEYLGRVVKSAERMRQLLHDLLQFSRIASRPDVFKIIDLGSIVRVAVDYYEPSILETGAKIEIEDIPAIEGDEIQMLQLFQNLIGNALRYRSEEAPLIKIYSEYHTPGTCEVLVADNGIGFAQEYSDLIFKPFQRLHGRGQYEGTGMGLAICRKIVERHGGMIRVESQPGKGSTFIISLPLKHSNVETGIAKAGF